MEVIQIRTAKEKKQLKERGPAPGAPKEIKSANGALNDEESTDMFGTRVEVIEDRGAWIERSSGLNGGEEHGCTWKVDIYVPLYPHVKFRHIEDQAALAVETGVHFPASALEHSGVVQNGHDAQDSKSYPPSWTRKYYWKTDVINSRARSIHSQQHAAMQP